MMNNKNILIITNKKLDNENFLVKVIKNCEFKIFNFIDSNLQEIKIADMKLILLYDNFKEYEGVDILKKLRNNAMTCKIPIIVVVENNLGKVINKYIDVGAYDFINKEDSSKQIEVRIRNAIEFYNTTQKLNEEITLFDTLLNNIPFMSWLKDKDSNYIKVNTAFKEHSGKTMDQIRGRGDYYVWDGKIGDRCKEFDTMVMNQKKQIMFDEVIEGKKGHRQFNIYKAPVTNNDGEVVGTIGVARDITDLKNKDTKVEILIENVPFEAWLKDINDVYVNANSKFASSRDMRVDEVVGKHVKDIWSKDKVKEFKREDREVIEKRKQLTFEKSVVNLKDEKKIMEITKTPVFDISNNIMGIVGIARDVTDIRKKQNIIKKYVYKDYLTGLDNRRSLYEYMNKKMQTNESNIALILIDIDGFKKINDSCGHNFGDKALVSIANQLRKGVEDAFIARFSGDEFIVVFENIVEHKDILDRVEKLQGFLNTYIKVEGCKCHVSASMGIGVATKNDRVLESLLRKADMAMYKAKRQGKRTYAFYEDGMELEMLKHINIEKDLYNAINNNEIEVYYQPLYCKDEKLTGFEALFRWKKEKYKNVPVIDIINIMEKSHLINTIGDYIIRGAFLFAKQINEKRKEKLIISVNISPKQIMSENFIERFTNIVRDLGVDTKCLAIEITETLFLHNLEENAKKISKIRDLGIKVYLDDFGTGYSSFSYLLKLPLSLIKIDRSFIKGIDERDDYAKLINLISDSAHSLNLPVIAEGVETREQMQVLNKMGIDYMQGYLFSKPLPQIEAKLLIERIDKGLKE